MKPVAQISTNLTNLLLCNGFNELSLSVEEVPRQTYAKNHTI